MTTTSNFQQRVTIGGSIAIVSFLLILFSDHFIVQWLFFACLTALITIACQEIYNAYSYRNYTPLQSLGIPTSTALCAAAFFQPHDSLLQLTVFFLFSCLLFAHFMYNNHEPMKNMACTVFAIVYLAMPLSLLFPILFTNTDGKWWLIYLIMVTKTTDTAAYFGGKAFGSIPLAPTLSPKKTLEGAIFGTSSALFVALICTKIVPGLSVVTALFSSFILSILAQFGDLSESLLKRDAGVKDSSDIPGVGGVLDMLDSLVFTTPALYLFLKWNIL